MWIHLLSLNLIDGAGGNPVPVTPELGRNMFGGGEEDFEAYRAKRRQRERELEAKETEARELRARAKEIEQKLAVKKKASKAKQALVERLDRIEDQITERELQISAIIVEINLLEQSVAFRELDRRRRLLLLATMM